MFKSNDDSMWKIIPASRLSAIEIWKGNRVLDNSHVSRIQESLQGSIKNINLNPFRVVLIHQEGQYLIHQEKREANPANCFS